MRAWTMIVLFAAATLQLSHAAPGKPRAPDFRFGKTEPIVAPKSATTGRLIVKLKGSPSEAEIQALAKRMGAKVTGRIPGGPVTLLLTPIPGKMSAPGVLKDRRIDYVESETTMFAMPVQRRAAPAAPPARGAISAFAWDGDFFSAPLRYLQILVPSDPYYTYQWGLRPYPYGSDLSPARSVTMGRGVTVAVVDTGIRRDLDDLAQTRFVPGWNTLTNSANTLDRNGHGTHVAGTIAQSTDNGRGCAGIAPQVSLMPVQALGADGAGSNFSIAAGITWAVEHGAKVLNLSLGGASSRVLQEAVRSAALKGTVLVAASGNAGVQGISYPAAYAEVISVGASTKEGTRATFSQYGPALNLVAPGVNILQQTFSRRTGQPGYFYFSGTSMATPHVAGTAALLLGLNSSLSITAIRQVLKSTAQDRGRPGEDAEYGAGILSIAAAVQAVRGGGPVTPVPGPEPPQPPPPGPEPTPQPPPNTSAEVARVLALFNQERASKGAPAVALQAMLVRAAEKHAAEMASRGVLSHTGADGSSPGDRITREGYRSQTWGEIIAAGQPTPETVVGAWVRSPGHHAIMTDPRYQDVGIAVARGTAGYRIYWCACWATSR